VVNKYSTFRRKSGYKSKGGAGQNSLFTLIQFMTRICACAKWTKANPRRDCAMCMLSSHSLSIYTRALHTIVDGYALHCRRCKVVYTHFVVVKQLCHSGKRMERRQVSDDVYIVGHTSATKMNRDDINT